LGGAVNRASDLDPKESLSHLMAYYLRRYREAVGMTQGDLAIRLCITASHLGNLERARRRITIDQARTLDSIFNLPELFENLHYHAQRQHRDWLEQYAALEAEASDVKVWQPLWLPGLLQTPAYAQATLEAIGSYVEDIESTVSVRMGRQAVLDRERPPNLRVLIDEKALTQGVGGPDVMREQIKHLLVLSERRFVSLQIVPSQAGSHAGLDGGFNIISTEEGDVAFVEAALGGRLVQDEHEVKDLGRRWDDIKSLAFSVSQTRERLLNILKGLGE
jgi:transcriptional regulator with XRE-family HTH domain